MNLIYKPKLIQGKFLMLRLPKKPRSYSSRYGNSYYKKSNRFPKISVLGVILALPVLIILSEFLAQAYLGITGKGNNIDGKSPLVKAYQLKFLTATQKPIAGLTDEGDLAVKRSSNLGYELVSAQKTEFFQINQQGLRDNDPLPLAKPKNEIRIFLLGGSTAFGQLNPNNNTTISHQLETRLKQRVQQQKSSPTKYRPDVFPFFVPTRLQLMKLPPKIREGNYRVINAAVPGYTSGNQLAQVALKILPYQPDLIVVLDGYGDVMLPSSFSQADVPDIDNFLTDAKGYFRNSLDFSVNQWLQNTALVKTVKSFSPQSSVSLDQTSLVINNNGDSLKSFLPKDQKELKQRVDRYKQNQKSLIQLSSRLGIPVILAIQPEITARPVDKLSANEKAIRDRLGKEYIEQFPKAYANLAKANQQLAQAFPRNVKNLDLYQGNSAFPTPMFSDTIHLTEQSNKVLAEKLYHAITAWEKIQIIPQNFYLKPVN
ncbi:GDSL-like lipase/acylhydrolase domain-containing protein [Rippkaea orientalis PCC 8801]|uniref:GDSL-like lipase/acylhydrolase domain-containing protein n=1 Tax=Rippkaea orientalis (strain PCC 8801 / RF-1) TaxID=41431 RepID=B7JXE6_RIPO1|nr:SGNH/GDSL hydrolase family protein [Rippkaea orientalis]ACK67134.1 GDSL-like lipase/acylhydrolase domain-containing protein [Rippkaea orientalis PCC 8801]